MKQRTVTVYRPEFEDSGYAKKEAAPRRNRGTAPNRSAQKRRKHNNIIHRIRRFFKRWNWKRIGLLALVIAGLIFGIRSGVHKLTARTAGTGLTETTADQTIGEYIFRDGDGYPVDMEQLTNVWASKSGIEKRYILTDEERLEVAQVLTAEAAGEPLAGKIAVAQCILQTCEDESLRPDAVLKKYNYSKRRPDPTDEAMEAVQDVFDFGITVTSEPIKYFYAPALVDSEWHESQIFVLTINGHRFFKEADND